MHGRAFTHVEHTHLNGRSIRIDTHLTAQCIELIHKMTFTRATNGRVARHKCNIIQTDGRHQRAMTHAGAGEGRLTTSMTATDDGAVEVWCTDALDGDDWYFVVDAETDLRIYDRVDLVVDANGTPEDFSDDKVIDALYCHGCTED